MRATIAILALLALFSSATAADTGWHRIPLLEAEPAPGSSVVNPESPLTLVFDRSDRSFKPFSSLMKKGAYRLTLNGSPVEAEYDGPSGTLQAGPPLDRYTDYTLVLEVDPRLIGRPGRELKRAGSYPLVLTVPFRTGSAPHEAAHLEVAGRQEAAVTDGTTLEVRVTDDYGLPSRKARVTLSAVEQGHRLPRSLVFNPGPREAEDGPLTFAINDTEAEEVLLSVTVEDLRFGHTLSREIPLTFLPGPPSDVEIAGPDKATVASGFELKVRVTDLFGNPVADGTEVRMTFDGREESVKATYGGEAVFPVTAPTTVSMEEIRFSSGEVSASHEISFEAGPPEKLRLSLPERLETGRPGTVSAWVGDRWGNPVRDIPVSFSSPSPGVSFTPPRVPTDAAGRAESMMTGLEAGQATVEVTAGELTVSSEDLGLDPVLVEAPQPVDYWIEAESEDVGKDGPFALATAFLPNRESVLGAVVSRKDGGFSFGFSGTDLDLRFVTGRDYGYARVYLNGVMVDRVNLYYNDATNRRYTLTRSYRGLPAGNNRVSIRAESDDSIGLDAAHVKTVEPERIFTTGRVPYGGPLDVVYLPGGTATVEVQPFSPYSDMGVFAEIFRLDPTERVFAEAVSSSLKRFQVTLPEGFYGLRLTGRGSGVMRVSPKTAE